MPASHYDLMVLRTILQIPESVISTISSMDVTSMSPLLAHALLDLHSWVYPVELLPTSTDFNISGKCNLSWTDGPFASKFLCKVPLTCSCQVRFCIIESTQRIKLPFHISREAGKDDDSPFSWLVFGDQISALKGRQQRKINEIPPFCILECNHFVLWFAMRGTSDTSRDILKVFYEKNHLSIHFC